MLRKIGVTPIGFVMTKIAVVKWISSFQSAMRLSLQGPSCYGITFEIPDLGRDRSKVATTRHSRAYLDSRSSLYHAASAESTDSIGGQTGEISGDLSGAPPHPHR